MDKIKEVRAILVAGMDKKIKAKKRQARKIRNSLSQLIVPLDKKKVSYSMGVFFK